MIPTLAEYKEHLLELYDPDEIVDVLSISTQEILDAFYDKVQEKYEKEFDTLEPTTEEDGYGG